MIIDTLYKRGYIIDKQIKATQLGIIVTDALKKNSPLILDEKLTRHFEKEMEAIQQSKKSKQEEERILKEAKTVLAQICQDFKAKEEKIGKELLKAHAEIIKEERDANKIILCPVCKKGFLVIKRNKQGKQFLACDSYPKCKTTFSLPYGFIKKTDKTCECGWPILIAIKKGKRPWQFCANPECVKKQKK